MSLRNKLNGMMDLFYELKETLRRANPRGYEAWQAGGFIVDENIVSMYPSITELVDDVAADDDDDDDDDDGFDFGEGR